MLLFTIIAPMKVCRRLHVHMPAGLLTQFQQLGNSLMEATERQTQPTPHESLNKHTLAVIKCDLRQLVPPHPKHPCFMSIAVSCGNLGCNFDSADMSCDGELLLLQQSNCRIRHTLCCECVVQSRGTSMSMMMP